MKKEILMIIKMGCICVMFPYILLCISLKVYQLVDIIPGVIIIFLTVCLLALAYYTSEKEDKKP